MSSSSLERYELTRLMSECIWFEEFLDEVIYKAFYGGYHRGFRSAIRNEYGAAGFEYRKWIKDFKDEFGKRA